MVSIDVVYMIGVIDGTDKNWTTVYYHTEQLWREFGSRRIVQSYITRSQFKEIRETLTITD